MPSLPVMPCTRTFVDLSTRMLMLAGRRASSTTFLAPSPMSSAITRARPDSASIFLPSSTLVPSIRRTTGSLRPSFFTAAIMPSASRSTRRMPPNTLMNTALTRRIGGQDAEGVLDLLRRGAAAHVEEVGGLAARELDDVHGGHGEARAVDHAADAAVELDVVEAVLRGLDVERRLLVDVAQGHDLGVAEERVVVEVELGVERHHAPVARHHERIDLGERAVLLEVGAEEVEDQRHAGLELVAGEPEAEARACAPGRPGARARDRSTRG